MFHHIHIPLTERAVIVRDGKPVRALGPGRYHFWARHEIVRWDIDQLTFEAPAAVLAAIPHDWYETVHVMPAHYGIVMRATSAR